MRGETQPWPACSKLAAKDSRSLSHVKNPRHMSRGSAPPVNATHESWRVAAPNPSASSLSERSRPPCEAPRCLVCICPGLLHSFHVLAARETSAVLCGLTV